MYLVVKYNVCALWFWLIIHSNDVSLVLLRRILLQYPNSYTYQTPARKSSPGLDDVLGSWHNDASSIRERPLQSKRGSFAEIVRPVSGVMNSESFVGAHNTFPYNAL
jgi:hypothetical protein